MWNWWETPPRKFALKSLSFSCITWQHRHVRRWQHWPMVSNPTCPRFPNWRPNPPRACVKKVVYRQLTRINFCYLVAPIFRGEFQIFFTNKHGLKEIPWTANCPMNLHEKNGVILWPLTSSKTIVLVAQPILTDGGPPAWAVDKRAELGWPSSRGKGWPAVCKSGPRLWKSTVFPWFFHSFA